MKQIAVVLALMIAIAAALAGCVSRKSDNYDIAGEWYSASGDESSVLFDISGTVIMQGYNTGTGLYTFNSGEMDGVIFLAGIVPRIQRVHLLLDDTLRIGGKEYVRD